MAEDKSGKGAYINNPEFPYKNLNIKKIERIRKSVSLGSQLLTHKNGINDEFGGKAPVPKQGNSQNYANSLSKKFSKSKNFIERNIEKISSLSKKNDMLLKTKKTCNRSQVVGYDVYKDRKKDTKEKATTVLGLGPQKNRATGGTTGNSGNDNKNVLSKIPVNHLKHKTTLPHEKHKSAECDSARNKTSSTNGHNNAHKNLRNARKFPGIGEKGNGHQVLTNFERSKSFARHYDSGGIGATSTVKLGICAASHASSKDTFANHSNGNIPLRRQKTLSGEETVGQNRRDKTPSTRIPNITAGQQTSETHLMKNTQISNEMVKRKEWVDMKNKIIQKEIAQNKEQKTNAPVALYQSDKDKIVTNEEGEKMEKKFKESSGVVSPYEEHEMKNKGSDYVSDRIIKREGTLESQRSDVKDIRLLEYDDSGEEVHMYTQNSMSNGSRYGGNVVEKDGSDGIRESGAREDGNEEEDAADEDNREEVAVPEESQGSGGDNALQKVSNNIDSPIFNNNGTEAGKKEFAEKSISLRDNSSLDTVTNYSVQSKKDYQSWGDKIKLKNGTSTKLRSADYTSKTMHNETGKAPSSRYAHLDSLGKKTNEGRFADNKNVNEFFGNVRNSIEAFDELLSRRFPILKGRSVSPSGMRVQNGGKDENTNNGATTIRGTNEALTSRDKNSLNVYRMDEGKSMEEDFSSKFREGQSGEMEKSSEDPKGMARTSIKSEKKFLFDRNSYNNVKGEQQKETKDIKHKKQANTHYGENEGEMIISEMNKLNDKAYDEYTKKSDTTGTDKELFDSPPVQNTQMPRFGNDLENMVEEGDSPTGERSALNEDRLKKELANSYDYEFSSSRKANHSLSGSNISPLHKNYLTQGGNVGNANESEAHTDDESYKSVANKNSTENYMEEEMEGKRKEVKQDQKEKKDVLKEREEEGEKEKGELLTDLPSHDEDKMDDKHSDGSSPKEQSYGEEGHTKEPNRGYFDKSINEDSVEMEHLYDAPENGNIPSRVFLTVNGKDPQKGVPKNVKNHSVHFNKFGGEPFAGRGGVVRAEEVTENGGDKPDEQDEDKHKFLCSSNETYHVDVLKMYNNKLSHDGGNKKNNKLINKNMILKEIFGSNYESSLKNDLNESSNVMGVDEEAGNIADEEVADEEVAEEEVTQEEVTKEDTEDGAEEGEQNYPHEDTTKKELSNRNVAIMDDSKYNHYVDNQSIGGYAQEPLESKFDKSNSVEKESFGSELANDDDSLLKRYEENSSPLILSKPFFNDKASESSYNTSVLMGRAKNESLTFIDTTAGGNSHKDGNRSGDVLLKKKELHNLEDTPNYTEEKQTHNAELSSEYKDVRCTSEKESQQIAEGKAKDLKMHLRDVVTHEWREYYGGGGDRYEESSDAKRVEEPNSENEIIKIEGMGEKTAREEDNNRAPNEEKGKGTDGLYTKKRKGSEHPHDHYIDEYEKGFSMVNEKIDERKKKEIDAEIEKYETRRDSQGRQYRSYMDYVNRGKVEGRNHIGEEDKDELRIGPMEENNLMKTHKSSWTRKAQRNNDGVANTENELTHGHNEIHGEKKNRTIWKYKDKKFLIYRDKLFEEGEKEANQRKSHMNDELLDTHYGKRFDVNKEREYLFDSMSDSYNYAYLKKGKSDKRTSQMMNLYGSIKSRMEISGNKESDSSNVKSVINDDYYLDYIKNRRKNSHKYEGEKSEVDNYNRAKQSSNENELTLNKRKRKNIFESDSLINDSKDEQNFDLSRNNNDFLDDVKKKIKKNDHIECSHLSYGNSECSKGAALYSSINETTNSSHTIVSKRSKYILKHSNASSLFDDVPLFFNFVNCSSIVLGSEIIYVTDETYGKCENILKDKPFNTANVERGYYEDYSNDLYNVTNSNLNIGIGHHRENLDQICGKGNVANFLSEPVNSFNEEKIRRGSGYPKLCNESGKWGECPGWLTKRRIKKYFDFCIVKLCKPTLIKGIDIDTNNFLGNYAPYVSIEGAYIEDDLLMSAESFSKYVDRVKYMNKKKNDFMFERDFFSQHPTRGRSGERTGAYKENGECTKEGNPTNRNNDRGADGGKNGLFMSSRNSSGENRYWSNDRRRLDDHVLNNREEVELIIDGKTYFKRNKYFYEPILIDPLDKSDQEYENYLEILRYNDKYKKLRTNPKSTSFVANGNEYRYIDNKLYTLVDVTKEIASRYPGIHKGCLLRSSSSPLGADRNGVNSGEGRGYSSGDGYGDSYEDRFVGVEGSGLGEAECHGKYRTGNASKGKRGEHGEHGECGLNGVNVENDQSSEEEEGNPLLSNSYNSNMLFLDNDYSIEKKIYNDLHKQYQWVSILEDERMNPGFQNYNHNCFNINTCNKIFTHLIVCLLPDGGINKLRVYGEIKISENVRKKSYKKTINVCDILDGSHVVYTTDEFYGKSENILIDQNSEYVMGWQTRRLINRPLRYVENLTINNMSSIFFNNNYCIIKLSFITSIKYIEINTIFYEYNFPLCVSIDYCYMKEVHSEEKSKQIQFFGENIENIQWKELLPLSYIKGNHINFFTVNGSSADEESLPDMVSSHLRLNIYPDGGINTIKAYGTVVEV
ncbi:conserved Plasmodium protein, unknown function [Plasmodium knowlesi strain H]|uniref:Allantoicase domain-containing protein n=3 Tax=Plasmodium knowlesi TaxID=5850 RepID=A0A5K1VK73_PLAKH|nr:conserved Plasmodium protein, unknown function [Plasmodium knowlesi strain H]OTN66509.1 Uncharacterized protein PKNOH_S09523500 [Plasmodium knowlesi]CAA9986403.1 conserved Plasmodium protein, unknown function [Plasmodium knowlesi strain H]SBO25679.1 conserved Plasmodium protein, unknown function [Plasmodium knowlesi strain H]SBO28387.1 conserved Plasmodium protein, unknown function [Plasmodium knowlesi strain H]VVS75877.1 conserved Plasmodium protein, unknown function [Plasmodium knowlesi s|eukprot:XP_002257809.1 hypothetical protein, conserved in Plasmodium species [Plasmodium knowlesi strain H]